MLAFSVNPLTIHIPQYACICTQCPLRNDVLVFARMSYQEYAIELKIFADQTHPVVIRGNNYKRSWSAMSDLSVAHQTALFVDSAFA